MGLWDKLKGELIDIIQWTEPSNNDLLAYRFPRYDNEISALVEEGASYCPTDSRTGSCD